MLSNVACGLGLAYSLLGLIVSDASAGDPTFGVPMQYGALGILAFMVYVWSKERREMVKSLKEEAKKNEDLHERTLDSCGKMATAAQQLVASVDSMVKVAKDCKDTQQTQRERNM